MVLSKVKVSQSCTGRPCLKKTKWEKKKKRMELIVIPQQSLEKLCVYTHTNTYLHIFNTYI